MTRARTSLREPPDDLTRFPQVRIRKGRSLWRIHRRAHDPRWFCSDGECRFDLPAPRGTLYVAEDPLGSFIEVFQDVRLVADTDAMTRRLSRLSCPHSFLLADCTSSAARGHGCTGEIHTTPDYGLTQRWAQSFHENGFDGIRYLVRHDPAQQLVGIAIFGQAGNATDWPEANTNTIDAVLLADASKHFGITVLPSP